jgi:hypothetical protein
MNGASERPAGELYEHSDVRLRPLALFGAGLLLLLGAALAISAWLSARLTAQIRGSEPTSPLRELRGTPDVPVLQPLPAGALAAQRARDEEQLERTAWIDPVNQVVRIPIERAMELVLQEGFPTRPQPEEQRR